ncbi:unnamed protein product [Darwinula stevensoni]|uniref:SSD domain-containing protein n=1 Tax=Darwinula stevensoni TaxID=69355 RepID=A0A7R9A8L9_9CRUS|nr:unnamed protein product [Darwinula stevensoni]CAG0896582.1 unnamed protein product [Darwinula stevensoni]
MGCHLAWVDQKLSYAAGLLGVAISKRPGYFFLIPVLVCCVFMTGIQRLESQYEDDPEYLFSPTDGRSKVDRAVIESYFPMNFSQYRFDRHTQKGRMARVLIFPKDNGTMLRTKYFKEVLFVDQMVRNVSFIYEDKELRFADVCATWDGECVGPGKELSLMDIMPDFETGKENLTSPIFIHPVTFDTLVVPYIFGGIQTNGEGVVTKTAGRRKYEKLKQDGVLSRGFLWEKAVVDALAKLNEGGLEFDDIYYFTSRTTEEELEANTNSVMPYFIFAVFVMVLFSCITCMTADWVRSKAILGLLGVVSSTLATLGAFGLVLYLGVPFIGINMAAPFLLLGESFFLERDLLYGLCR